MHQKKCLLYTYIINSIVGAKMKTLKIIGAVLLELLFDVVVAAIALTIWANKPRGIKIY